MKYSCNSYHDYEQCFVPALFGPWSEFLVSKVMGAGPWPNQTSMLDVACGTGIVARTALSINPNVEVSGVDSDPDMLGIASSILPQSNWCLADGASLPFPDDHFDYALNQFGLMFFENPQASIREMVRVTKSGGKIGIAVWGRLSEAPAYSNVLKALTDYLSIESLEFLYAPYSLSDHETLRDLMNSAEIKDFQIQKVDRPVSFESIEQWLGTEFRYLFESDAVTGKSYYDFYQQATEQLDQYVQFNGSISFNKPANIVSLDVR